ncbi:MAG: hypothetical protein M9949_09020 [Candidatus Kapabacteria bacterium]|nr:hypothetical protein [Candidatus Kapabacteria bacterium]
MDVYDIITIDEVTPDMQLLADVCGEEAMRQILRHLGGTQFYIPKMSKFDRFVIRFYNQNKDKPLKYTAIQLGVSEQYLRNKIAEMKA